ncbi:iron-sulfur cluster assembly accessory protein [Paenibacillus sp. MWE-103]|uniref:Iron-sulfur cluster assembly accessory protein n=1 Tax=Paenibacillus artemisiicola TaxID=1172618 RepID=A0ABS3WCP9_9BACL|nr:iron-sulfur cluster assembly accessory protein [Paenibacillus artemisiicola]MBO7746069.1 iron-sulfur cluster assembly accessory protein [Paenibacillus artemisiicola]
MKVKISRNAAKMLREEIDNPENEGKFLRVYVTHSHGDHAHYGMKMDDATEKDEVVETDKDIKVVLEQGNEWLDGVRIDYFYVPEEGFMISNPAKGNGGDH